MVTRDIPWPAGTPCWVDVSVDDVSRAVAFYSGLFGWDIEIGGDDVGGYSVCRKDDRIVAGISPKMGPPGTPSAWTTYVATEDTDATADKIKEAGGELVVPPMDVLDLGRMALAFDPTGAAFGLWQGRATTGVGLANETGSLSWNEHLSGDFDAAKAFYRAVFGYDYHDVSEGSFRYATLMIDGHEVGGVGQYPADTPAGTPAAWAVYFAVDDTDAAVTAVTSLGGSVVRPIMDSPFGRIGVVADDQGAIFSVITSPNG